MQNEVLDEIRRIERRAEEIKMMSRLDRISILDAKNKLRELNEKLQKVMDKLPPHDRELYKFRKEYKDIIGG